MTTAIDDDMLTPDVIAEPYSYYGRIRDEDPVHWNENIRRNGVRGQSNGVNVSPPFLDI